MPTFAERLTEALKIRGVTAAELARALNVSDGTISNYKKGTYEPKQRRTDKISQILKVSVDWLLGGDVPMNDVDRFDDLTNHEKDLIVAYRNKPELQPAVDKLLDVPAERQEVLVAARNGGLKKRPITDDEQRIINEDSQAPEEL